jgi:myo-inositol-1(or 4)-monophosphatase
MAYISPVLTAIAGAVKKASTALVRDFNELEHLQSSVHNDGSFASRSYDKAEKILGEELAKVRPNYPFVCKKNATIPAGGNYFLVDPIDGLVNFAHGNGCFAMSVALVENNVLTDAVVYNPVSDELFFAEKGCGAFKEGFRSHERLRVAARKELKNALIGCSPDVENIKKALSVSPNLSVKSTTALDLAYVAAGKFDAVISANNPPYASGAGLLLVKEAGGYAFMIGETDVRTENITNVLLNGNIVATNEALRQKIAIAVAK